MIDHDEVQAALSARLDGEPSGLDEDVVDAHVAGCETCSQFWEESLSLSRRLNFVESSGVGMSPPKDLSEIIIAGVEPEWRKNSANRLVSLTVARALAALLAVGLVVWAIMMVLDTGGLMQLSSDGRVLSPEAQPEVAALLIEGAAVRLALAVGLGLAAWQPRMAGGMAPVVATLWAFLTGFAVRDIVLGAASLAQIAQLGVLALVTVVLVWLWGAGRGLNPGQLWRSLSAQPN
ncbi:zf-HC2 domain-containing protein [Corynebacterium sp.]|uniref:zf-HC2 domain-containing protein n=1 Tax=Corynebacterium sp. TaxID=1720 RepID=UPI0037356CAF